MIIIRLQGGLGNQMFQYALYKELKMHRDDVRVDITPYISNREKREWELGKVFGIEVNVASWQEIFKIAGGERRWIERIIRKYLKSAYIYKEEIFSNVQEILQKKDAYIDGYWQNESWFFDVAEELRKEFAFKNDEKILKKKYPNIWLSESVSIHIRMGDYLENEELYGGICTKEYYEKAIKYIKNSVNNPFFFIFSDEPQKAREILGDLENVSLVTGSEQNFYDMQLMSCCKHNILANSSFSWWGAWLNSNEQKIVVAPKKWNNIEGSERILLEEWIKV